MHFFSIFLGLCVGIVCLAGVGAATLSSKAAVTYYNSYPQCCPDSPNYDPAAPTEECDDYSGCEYLGDFAAFCSDANEDCHVSIEYVQTHNLVAFYDDSDPKGKHWQQNYANKTIELTKVYAGKTYVFNATIVDTCGNTDCHNCCSRNADKSTGYLVDMEYYTVMNTFGTTEAIGGEISFRIF